MGILFFKQLSARGAPGSEIPVRILAIYVYDIMYVALSKKSQYEEIV